MREKYPFTGDLGNTHAVIPTPEWGGGGGVGGGGLKSPATTTISFWSFQGQLLC